jgi:hypothetical protein
LDLLLVGYENIEKLRKLSYSHALLKVLLRRRLLRLGAHSKHFQISNPLKYSELPHAKWQFPAHPAHFLQFARSRFEMALLQQPQRGFSLDVLLQSGLTKPPIFARVASTSSEIAQNNELMAAESLEFQLVNIVHTHQLMRSWHERKVAEP